MPVPKPRSLGHPLLSDRLDGGSDQKYGEERDVLVKWVIHVFPFELRSMKS